ncbi:hypothetical protein K431DRAFT_295171 [Polychaeton citri CBS 116435]|uniref:Protein phosphatase 4 core regulatory subunit R2 n=1 Tax=Polychaeton citri CBS 116435 TaxID=1314669 RepID=A0A9P4UNA9_9PEZI|nr:hypothetical protein K431DRAFT_295171 [Polychaeton citri CBS 116435]
MALHKFTTQDYLVAMTSSDDILAQAARDGSIDIAEWPRVLESVLQKLHNIVHNDFPIPRIHLPAPLPSSIDPEVVASTPPGVPGPETQSDSLPDVSESGSTQTPLPTSNSQGSQKENDAPPIATSTSDLTQRPNDAANSSQTQLLDEIEAPAGTLPPELLSLYTNSTRILEQSFARSPPYTVQRLAELVLQPRKHYRYLPSYLRALDRAVSVSSPASDFPLPVFQASPYGGFLTNGNLIQVNGDQDDNLGSDESLGGALLTPISWLRNQQQQSPQEGEFHSQSTETIQGPNGAGRIETVTVTVNGVPSASSAAHTSPNHTLTSSASHQSDLIEDSQLREHGAVTQGELLRQEQELGVVPVAHSQPRRQHIVSGAIAVGRDLQTELAGDPSFSSSSTEYRTLPEQTRTSHVMSDSTADNDQLASHLCGPDDIGMEDIGSQNAFHTQIDIDSAVGRQRSPPQPIQQQQQSLAAVVSPSPTSAISSQPIQPAPQAEADAAIAQQDNSGAPGQDPRDVELQVDRLKEQVDEAKKEEAAEETAEQSKEEQDRDGDVVVVDVDGKAV